MTAEFKIPDVAALKRLDEAGFLGVVCDALGRHGIRAPRFNLAAGVPAVAPSPDFAWKMLFFPAEAQHLIFSCIRAMHEYDRDGKVCPTTREEFIVADVQDRLRDREPYYTADEHKALCEKVLDHVSSQLTAIGSLAFAPAVSGKAPKAR